MKPATILIADDDRVILATLAEGLTEAGYNVLRCKDGKEAVKLSKSEKPDLAILDMRMPKMSGVEAGQKLREETRVPFIFLSAYSDETMVEKAIDEGALGYLVKPLDIPQIVPTIEAALKHAEELNRLGESTKHLNIALKQDKSVSVAVGLLMERHGYSEKEAFDYLHRYARNHRQKLVEIAREVVYSTEVLNRMHPRQPPNNKNK